MPREPHVFDNEYGFNGLDLSDDNLAKAEYHPYLNDCGEISQYDYDDPELYTMCTAVAKVYGNKHIIRAKHHDPKCLAPNFAFVLEDLTLKPLCILPSLHVSICGYHCNNTSRVIFRRQMSAISM
jgi:hypothetical protein